MTGKIGVCRLGIRLALQFLVTLIVSEGSLSFVTLSASEGSLSFVTLSASEGAQKRDAELALSMT
ncbi:MAG: hypothetical protein C4335_03920 [Armatimonadota bacterium]